MKNLTEVEQEILLDLIRNNRINIGLAGTKANRKFCEDNFEGFFTVMRDVILVPVKTLEKYFTKRFNEKED